MDSLLSTTIRSLVELLAGKVHKSEELAEVDDLELISNEAKQQKLELQVAFEQAKVAQEIAIAARIQDANEVVLEEYYEYTAKGQLGLATDNNSVSVGASGEGRRVTKRIYRFIGNSSLREIKEISEDS